MSAFSNDSGYLTEHQSLVGYATETFVTEKIAAIPPTDLSGYYTKAEVDALIASINGGGGTTSYTITVSNDGNGTASADMTTATENTVVTLTNTPNEGYNFKEWQVVSGTVTITDNKFTMPASNVEVKAVFEASSGGGGEVATAEISGNTELKCGLPRTYTATFKDASGNEVTDVACTWNVISDYTVEQIVTGNQIELYYEDDTAIGETFLLQVLVDGTVLKEIEIMFIDF